MGKLEELARLTAGLLAELNGTLTPLLDVGLGYLTLDRAGATLSTGERQRIELTRGLIASHAAATYRVESRGETRTERLVSLLLLGDLVSVYVAVLRGVDPTPVVLLERLKGELARG